MKFIGRIFLFVWIVSPVFGASIIGINPDNAEQGHSLSVTITGQNTHFAQGSPSITNVWLTQGSPTIYAGSFWANSDTSLSANFNIPPGASTGPWDVKVSDTVDGTLTLVDGFTINTISPSPVLISINPDNASQGQSLGVTITGQNTHFGQGSSTVTGVWFTQGSSTINAANFWTNSDTSLSANFNIPEGAATGSWDVKVFDSIDGTLTLGSGFTINSQQQNPVLISINPDNAAQGQSLGVTITGQNTHFMQGSSTTVTNVWLTQGSSTINAGSFWANSDTSLSANFNIPPGASTGPWDVKVSDTIDGTLTLVDGFTINTISPSPVLISINPDNASQGQSLGVTITGQNTHFGQGSSTVTGVWFTQGSSTINAANFWTNSDTSLSANFNIPEGASIGLWDVKVSGTIDGTLTLANGFEINDDIDYNNVDIDKDGDIDFSDFAILANFWMAVNCTEPNWCEGADIDRTGDVNTTDLLYLADNWLTIADWRLPISHWEFDEGSGTIINDSVGNNNGTVHGAAWTIGQIGGALDFATDDFVEINGANDSSLEFTKSSRFSISCWVKPLPTNGYILCKMRAAAQDGVFGYDLCYSDTNADFRFSVESSRRGYKIIETNTVIPGNWYHIVAVYDNTYMAIYMNSILQDTDTFNVTGGTTGPDKNMVIGVRSYDTVMQGFFSGTIDDVRIYNRILSETEIQRLYNGNLPKASSPVPANGAVNIDVNVALHWDSSISVGSYDVYLGTDFNDVSNADTSSSEFKGNQPETSYGLFELDVNTTYFWRIDEHINSGAPNKGDTWMFTTIFSTPDAASNPIPDIDATDVISSQDLTWTPGSGAASHDVYFGTVNPPPFIGNQTAITYDTGTMDSNTTYYWRIDEKNALGTTIGDIWSFKTSGINLYLVSRWRFDEGSGTIANDSSGGNIGTIYGATWVTGQINGALNFDGSNDYVEIPDNDNSLDMDNQMTISAWIKVNNLSSHYAIVTKQPSGTAGSNYPGNYEFRINPSSGSLYFAHQTGTGTTWTGYTSTSPVTAGVWQHVAVTLQEGVAVKFYRNGAPAGTSPQTTTFGIVNNEPVRIGKRKGDYYFNGAIDDVRIYNRALSDTEISQIYQEGLNP